MRIEEEIKQSNFKSEFQKAHINLLFTASWLENSTGKLLKPFNISIQQFNVLRILRGQHPKPATMKLLSERMIDKMSNASRLVDKLTEKGLAKRAECKQDRRRVDVSITDGGLALLKKASAEIDNSIDRFFSSMSTQEAAALNSLLDKLRITKNCQTK